MTSSLGTTTPIEPIYVTDTHALIWYLSDQSKLGENAKSIFDAAEKGETQIVIPAIVIAEMYYANRRSSLFDNFWSSYERLRNSPFFQFELFTHTHVLDFDRDSAVPEMHDRIIVGVARRLDVPLITVDRQITTSRIVRVVW